MTQQSKRDAMASQSAITEAESAQKCCEDCYHNFLNIGEHQHIRGFQLGYDAREPEIAELKEALEVYATKYGKEAIKFDDLQSQLTAAREEARALREALEDILLQRKGLNNNWCGIWYECTECKATFAKGGNWTVKYQEEKPGKCHFCRAEEALAAHAEREET